jgi:hypothetical protein
MLLGHPDSTVRSCAAEALQYFLPAPATLRDGLACTPKAALLDSKNSGDDEEEAIALRYSVYLLSWYKSTNTDAKGTAGSWRGAMRTCRRIAC